MTASSQKIVTCNELNAMAVELGFCRQGLYRVGFEADSTRYGNAVRDDIARRSGYRASICLSPFYSPLGCLDAEYPAT
jgi:hypothetical protein